jgi:hypothetical protein
MADPLTMMAAGQGLPTSQFAGRNGIGTQGAWLVDQFAQRGFSAGTVRDRVRRPRTVWRVEYLGVAWFFTLMLPTIHETVA